MLLPELRQMAANLGIPEAATMRKSELIEAIEQRGNGGNKNMTTSDIPEDDVIEEFREEVEVRTPREDREDDRGYQREDRGYQRNDRNDDRGYRRNDRKIGRAHV